MKSRVNPDWTLMSGRSKCDCCVLMVQDAANDSRLLFSLCAETIRVGGAILTIL